MERLGDRQVCQIEPFCSFFIPAYCHQKTVKPRVRQVSFEFDYFQIFYFFSFCFIKATKRPIFAP